MATTNNNVSISPEHTNITLLLNKIKVVQEHLPRDLANITKDYLEGIPDHIYVGAVVVSPPFTVIASCKFNRHWRIRQINISRSEVFARHGDEYIYDQVFGFNELYPCRCVI